MLVSKKHGDKLAGDSNGLPTKRYKTPLIDWEAVFYAHASPETEYLSWDEYADVHGYGVITKRGKK